MYAKKSKRNTNKMNLNMCYFLFMLTIIFMCGNLADLFIYTHVLVWLSEQIVYYLGL